MSNETDLDVAAAAEQAQEPAASAGEVADSQEPQKSPEAEAIAAFEKGVAEATPETRAEATEANAPIAGEGAAAKAQPGSTSATGMGELPAEAVQAGEGESRPDPVEEEIASLGLKEKTAERFRELSKRPSEAEIAPLRERAERADAWEREVAATGASPEQFGATVQYTALAVRANSGDLEAAKQAYAASKAEAEHWAKMLGIEVPGHDPLALHEDLRREVDSGDLTRPRALEIAQQRAAAHVQAQSTQRSQEESGRRAAYESAMSSAMSEIGALNNQLKATDPAFAQKLPLLQPTIDVIREQLHPSQWAGAIRAAYAKIPSIPAPAPIPPVSQMPIRPTGSATSQRRVPRNDVEAFEMGVASVR